MDSWITAFNTGADSNAGLLAAASATDNNNMNIEEKYGSIEHWNTSEVIDMSDMFGGAVNEGTAFNQDISSWDTSKVTTMYRMFRNASAFDGDISSWNTSSVLTMSHMFSDAKVYN